MFIIRLGNFIDFWTHHKIVALGNDRTVNFNFPIRRVFLHGILLCVSAHKFVYNSNYTDING